MPSWRIRAAAWGLALVLAAALLALPQQAGAAALLLAGRPALLGALAAGTAFDADAAEAARRWPGGRWPTGSRPEQTGSPGSTLPQVEDTETAPPVSDTPGTAGQPDPADPPADAEPTPAAPTSPPDPAGLPPEGLENPGTITAKQFPQGSGEGYVTLKAGSIKNATDLPDSDLRAAAENGTGRLPFAVEADSAEPQVLILHTHATETYQPWDALYFDRDFTARTEDRALNMCAVGERMAQVLNAAGICTLHDTTLHDSPSYTESYARSAETTRRWLEQYPSIKVVLDVHRDALGDEDTRVKPLCTLNGEPAAQVMLIAGCSNGTTVPLPNWRLNLKFAASWEAKMEADHPGLTRPVLCGYRYYNQDLTTGSLLIEVGGHANTLAEALRAAEYAAGSLAELLLKQ